MACLFWNVGGVEGVVGTACSSEARKCSRRLSTWPWGPSPHPHPLQLEPDPAEALFSASVKMKP